METKLKELFEYLEIGNITCEPTPVTGGLLHKVYKVIADKGIYAVKLLNDEIINRPNVIEKIEYSEEVARVCLENGINAIPANMYNLNTIVELNGMYFMVFDWLEATTLPAYDVDLKKCNVIGKVLADIHDLNIEATKSINVPSKIDWIKYATLIENRNFSFKKIFLANIELLTSLEEKANVALNKLDDNVLISHRDLDQKNVLWNDDEAMIIDWESVGPVNPLYELLDVGLYWASEGEGLYNLEALITVIKSYLSNGGIIINDIESGLFSILIGKFGWLDYNLKRALNIIDVDSNDQLLGIKEVESTTKEIINYSKYIPEILENIKAEDLY